MCTFFEIKCLQCYGIGFSNIIFGYKKKSLYGIVDLGAALTKKKIQKGEYDRIGLTHERTVFMHVSISHYTTRKDKWWSW